MAAKNDKKWNVDSAQKSTKETKPYDTVKAIKSAPVTSKSKEEK